MRFACGALRLTSVLHMCGCGFVQGGSLEQLFVTAEGGKYRAPAGGGGGGGGGAAASKKREGAREPEALKIRKYMEGDD